MRIVQLITRLIHGGAQRIALETAVFLRAQHHEAVLWCGPETGAEGSLHEEASARGVPVRIFPELVRKVDPGRDLRVRRALAAAMREHAPDWVHTHSSKAGIVGREAAGSASVPRIAHTAHGWGFTPDTFSALRALFIYLERRAARSTDWLLFVSAADHLESERLRIIPRGHSEVLPHGIDLAPYRSLPRLAEERRRIRSDLGWDESLVVAGFLGRLSPQKAPQLVLEVAGQLAADFPHLRWLLVGDGPLGPALRGRTSRDPILSDRVAWAGLQPHPAGWLASMDLLLLPSRWEGAPLTAMEAMAAGLPVVASQVPGTSLLLEGGALGALLPAGDVERFAAEVARLASDEPARERLGRAARTHALARFGLEPMLHRLLQIYESG